MKKINKYIYGWKLWVNYGQGWEYETFEETYKGYIENRKAYRENCAYPQKWTQGRELNPEWFDNKVHETTKERTECSGYEKFQDYGNHGREMTWDTHRGRGLLAVFRMTLGG